MGTLFRVFSEIYLTNTYLIGLDVVVFKSLGPCALDESKVILKGKLKSKMYFRHTIVSGS